jgi:hypothetical protein
MERSRDDWSLEGSRNHGLIMALEFHRIPNAMVFRETRGRVGEDFKDTSGVARHSKEVLIDKGTWAVNLGTRDSLVGCRHFGTDISTSIQIIKLKKNV